MHAQSVQQLASTINTNVKFNKITSQQLQSIDTIKERFDKNKASAELRSSSLTTQIKGSQQPPSHLRSSKVESSMSTEVRMSQLGKALKRLLDPATDHLLPGYSELIQMVKNTLVAAKEERKAEEEAYFQAQVSRFNKDRRQLIKKDQVIREFLTAKKADIYKMIEYNMKKLVKFPDNPSLIQSMTAEEKVDKIRESLRNPQLQILADYVKHRKIETFIPSNVSPLTRHQKLNEQRRHNSQMSRHSYSLDDNDDEDGKDLNEDQRRYVRETRDLKLSDLGVLLEDLEVIELEEALSDQVYNVPGLKRSEDTSFFKNKQMLEKIQEGPSLAELIERTIHKQDKAAAEAAQLKMQMMEKHSQTLLSRRVYTMLGIGNLDDYKGSGVSLQETEKSEKKVSQRDLLYNPTDPDFDATPSRRQLHKFHTMISDKMLDPSNTYVPYLKQVSGSYPPHRRVDRETDGYRFLGLESVLGQVKQQYKFNDDIDNSEEEHLTDDELRERIKERKVKERHRRDGLQVVRLAAVTTARNVEKMRKELRVSSLVTNNINLEALKLRHAKLRDKMEMDTVPVRVDEGSPKTTESPSGAKQLNQRSGREFNPTSDNLNRLLGGYEPCEEDDEDQESSNSDISRYDRLHHHHKRSQTEVRDPELHKLERQMQKLREKRQQGTLDSLDRDKLEKYEFKASFISHLAPVRQRQDDYVSRLKQFNHRKSTIGDTVNQPYLEKKIYEKMYKVTSQSRLESSTLKGDGSSINLLQRNQGGSQTSLDYSNDQGSPSAAKVNRERIVSRVLSKQGPSQSQTPVAINDPAQLIHSPHSQSQPSMHSPSATSPSQQYVNKMTKNRGQDLSCANTSRILQTNLASQAMQQTHQVSGGHPSAAPVQENTGSSNEFAMGNNQFSKMSLKIVLSPRTNSKGLIQSQSQQQYIQQTIRQTAPQSTVTIHELPHRNANQDSRNELGGLTQNEHGDLQFQETLKFQQERVGTQERESKVQVQVGGTYNQTSRSLIGTHSSASLSGAPFIVDHKLHQGQSNSPSQEHLLLNEAASRPDREDFAGQAEFDPIDLNRQSDLTQKRSPSSKLVKIPSVGPENPSIVAAPQPSETPRQDSKQTKLNLIDLSQQNAQQFISFERNGSQLARLSGDNLFYSNNPSKVTSEGGPGSPHFHVSQTFHHVHNSKMRATKRQVVEKQQQEKLQVKTTEFDIPLPQKPTDLQVHFNDPVQQVPTAFKQQVIRRFGGTTMFGNFKNFPKNSSFYFQQPIIHEEMNKTQPAMTTGTPQHNLRASYSNSVEKSQHSIQQQTTSNESKNISFGKGGTKKDMGVGVQALGPTEYMSLSSGLHTPEEVNGPSKRVRLLIREHEAAETSEDQQPKGQQVRMKNVVKLQLRERTPSRSPKRDQQQLQDVAKSVSRVETGIKDDGSKSDAVEAQMDQIDQLKPKMTDQGINTAIAIKDQLQVSELISTEIKVGNKLVDQRIQKSDPKRLATQLNLFDVAKNALEQKPTGKNREKSPTRTRSQKKGISQIAVRQQDRFNQAPALTQQLQKLNIQILPSTELDAGGSQSSLRKSPSAGSKAPAAVGGKVSVQKQIVNAQGGLNTERQVSFSNRNTMITPKLQSTNVKIALQREKSKQLIQILKQQNNFGGSALDQKRPTERLTSELNKTSLPFLEPKKIDLGLNLGTEFSQNARATQEFNRKQLLLGKESKLSSMMQLGQQTTEDGNHTNAAEYAIDQAGQFRKVINRKVSQPDNPLLQGSDEDETFDGTMLGPGRDTQFGSIDSIGEHNISKYKTTYSNDKREVKLGQGFESIEAIAGKTYGSHVFEAGINSGNVVYKRSTMYSNEDDSKSIGGGSQVRIENDIKEMQSLLPPLLDTASTKRFLENDEINAGENSRNREHSRNQRHYQPKQDSIPLAYIRDSSKLSDMKQVNKDQSDQTLLGQVTAKPSRNVSKYMRTEAPIPIPIKDQNQHEKAVEYMATPLSILQENPVQSEIGTQSLLVGSSDNARSRAISVSLTNNTVERQHNHQHTEQVMREDGSKGGHHHRIKLPTVRPSKQTSSISGAKSLRSSTVAQMTGRVTRQKAPFGDSQTAARSSITMKNNNVFTTRDSETGGILEKRMANNFQVKIKGNGGQSGEGRNFRNRTHVDGAVRLTDFNQSSLGEQLRNQVGSTKVQFATKDHPVSKISLDQKFKIYGGGGVGGVQSNSLNRSSFQATNSRWHNGKGRNGQSMHQTHNAMLGDSIDVSQAKPQLRMPPKSLLFKNQQKKGLQTTRQSPQPTSYDDKLFVSPAITLSNMGKGSDTSKISRKQQIHSGSIDLTPGKKMQLAANINESLLPALLPELLSTKQLASKERDSKTVSPNESRTALKKKADASNMIIRSSIRESIGPGVGDPVLENARESIKSQTDDERFKSVILPAESNQDGLHRSQVSHDTLIMSKQVSTISPKKMKEVQIDEEITAEANFSHGKTDQGWQASFREDSDINLHTNAQPFPFAQTSSQPEILNARIIGIDAGEQSTSPDGVDPPSKVATEQVIPVVLTKEQELFAEHQRMMEQYKTQQALYTTHESFMTKQPISYTGQKDISNSVWVDTIKYAQKKKPKLLLNDLDERIRNGKREEGKSPFEKMEFMRLDGEKITTNKLLTAKK